MTTPPEKPSDEFQKNSRVDRLAAENLRMRDALKFYAEKDAWAEFISNGNIFGECEGDHMMAFDKGEDFPWSIAREALSQPETTRLAKRLKVLERAHIHAKDYILAGEYKESKEEFELALAELKALEGET